MFIRKMNNQNDVEEQKTTHSLVEQILRSGSEVFSREEIIKFLGCVQCGVCVGSCPSSMWTAWRARLLIRKMQLKSCENILSDESLWFCTTCYTCQERCPKQIPITDIIKVVRNLAVKHGYMKDTHKRICSFFLTYGHAVPPTDEIKKIRKALGLAELPPTVCTDLRMLKEVLGIIEKTGFNKIYRE